MILFLYFFQVKDIRKVRQGSSIQSQKHLFLNDPSLDKKKKHHNIYIHFIHHFAIQKSLKMRLNEKSNCPRIYNNSCRRLIERSHCRLHNKSTTVMNRNIQ